MVKVRFAPSPTGVPHLGNTRTALYNFLFARHHHGQFVLRIEDTDQARLVPGSQDQILEILKFLGLDWDEGPYFQSQRLKLYRDYAHQLVKKGLAYYDDQAIRLKMPPNQTLSWHDLIQGPIEFDSSQINDPVLLKSDGWPTYHLAVVVDDHLMEISHVLRAAEWISSTPKHLFLYQALGWQPPHIGHFSVILGPDKAKLSKRHGAKSILEYRDEGYLPQALLTFMAYLGWTFKDNSQLLTLDQLIDNFDLDQVHKSNPIFDQKKLDYFNATLIRETNTQDLLAQLKPFIPADCPPQLARKILPLVKNRLIKLSQWEPSTAFFYRQPSLEKLPTSPQTSDQLKAAQTLLHQTDTWQAQSLEAKFRQAATERNWLPADWFMLLRLAVTGRSVTPPLFATMEILGKNQVLSRLAHAQNAILQ